MEWWIAAFGALVGTISGFFLSLWLIKMEGRKKKKALLDGFYLEFSMIKENIESFLDFLDDEFKKPIRESYSGAVEQDFHYIDSIALHLIAQSHVINENQRLFIARLKRTVAGLMKKDEERHNKISKQGNSKFNIPINQTAYMIYDCVQLIYYLNDFILKKEKFDMSSKQDVSISGQARVAYKLVGLEFDEESWDRIKGFHDPIQ